MLFTMLIVGGFIACGKEFVFLWLDDTRIQVFYVCCIFMVLYSLTCCNRAAVSCRRIQNQHIKASLIYLGIAIFNIALSLVLVNLVDKEKALWACVAGTAITYVIGQWIIMQIYDKKVTKIDTVSFFIRFCEYALVAFTLDVVIIRFFGLLEIDNLLASLFIKGGVYLIAYLIIAYFMNIELFRNVKSKIKTFVFRKR